MSEPRKSRREAKPTQRLKEFLGEEIAKNFTPAKTPKTPKNAATPRSITKNEKPAVPAKSVVEKSPLKKVAATVKSTPLAKTPLPKASQKTTSAAKAAKIIAPAENEEEEDETADEEEMEEEEEEVVEPVTPTVSRTNVTFNVKKTSIKAVKKVTSGKGLLEKAPEVLQGKRVPKPSAKIAEALEAEAETEIAIKKTTPASSAKISKTLQSKSSTPTSVRGGRGRGSRGGRGRGRGRGRGAAGASLSDEEMEEHPAFKDPEDEETDASEDEIDSKFMDVDEESNENEDGQQIAEKLMEKTKKEHTKPTPVVKKTVTANTADSSTEVSTSKSTATTTSVVTTVKVPVSGTTVNTAQKKASAISPIKVATQVAPKDVQMSPAKIGTVKQVSKGSSGVKRILTAASPPHSPLTKKVKLSSQETDEKESSAANNPIRKIVTAAVPSKSVPSKVQPATVVSSSYVLSPNGVPNKINTVKTVTKTLTSAAAAKLSSKAANTISKGPPTPSDSENRRSRRQPKPTERMKEFLHKSSEEEEDIDADDPSALLNDDDESSSENEEDDRRFLAIMNKANAVRNKNSEFANRAKLHSSGGTNTSQKNIRSQIVRKGSSSGPFARSTTVMMQNKVISGGSLKTAAVVQVQTKKFAPGSKVMVQPPTSVNGDLRKILPAVPGREVKGTSAKVLTATRRNPTEPPIIIKIRTRKPEEDELLKKKRAEEEKQAGTRKIIKIFTQRGEVRKLPKRSGGSRSEAESESIESEEEDMDDEEEDEDEGESEDEAASNLKPLSEKNKKLLHLFGEAIESLKSGLKSFKKEPSQPLSVKTIEKFIRLSSEIADTVRETIEDLGDQISNSDNFEEYCQDVLDSIPFSYGEDDDLSNEEADNILAWLHQREKASKKAGESLTTDNNAQLALFTQMLELLTTAKDKNDTFDDEDEMMDEEDEDMMDMDDEATYGNEDVGGVDEAENMDDGQEEEEEEEGMDEEEEEAVDDLFETPKKSSGRR
ncbi:nucleolar protein dao-5 [Hyalella azteca]|uniref:Nucleolar protein dao-5 n=1 Tax=Hyalella azteca TaxID=294128 RepID=A0A8B7PNX0_HYAAZ|nr:nucleolar protein dao-5 [Hyalella azteca]